MPAWALTWPGGQLSGIGRNGRFRQNIQRYENALGVEVEVVPLSVQSDGVALGKTLGRIVGQATRGMDDDLRHRVEAYVTNLGQRPIRRNAGQRKGDVKRDPTETELELLRGHFAALEDTSEDRYHAE